MHSIYVSSFSAPGPRWGTSVPQTPCSVPPSKFLATPLIMGLLTMVGYLVKVLVNLL